LLVRDLVKVFAFEVKTNHEIGGHAVIEIAQNDGESGFAAGGQEESGEKGAIQWDIVWVHEGEKKPPRFQLKSRGGEKEKNCFSRSRDP
jgi:hypothetical protein